jgi:hypothetical protein
MGDAHPHLQSILIRGRAIVNTVTKTAGESRASRRLQALAGLPLHSSQRIGVHRDPARVARPLQVRQRLSDVRPHYAPTLWESSLGSWLNALPGRCHEVEGKTLSLRKAWGFCAVVQEPAVQPALPTPKILSAIKQSRSVDPPEMFLGGGAPSSPTSLRTRPTLPPHTGKPAIVCLDAFGSPRGNWRG